MVIGCCASQGNVWDAVHTRRHGQNPHPKAGVYLSQEAWACSRQPRALWGFLVFFFPAAPKDARNVILHATDAGPTVGQFSHIASSKDKGEGSLLALLGPSGR